jgi:hypothetical protein
MPTYIALANWTDQGAQQVKQSPKRVDLARKALNEMGGEFRSLYMTLGDYDLVFIYEAPDDAVAGSDGLGAHSHDEGLSGGRLSRNHSFAGVRSRERFRVPGCNLTVTSFIWPRCDILS